jgi:hydroxyethylthiazole kinase-like uncharacterized protein yjeF
MPTSPVLPTTSRLPLHDVALTRAIEQRAAAGLPEHSLMRRAGTAVARLALAVAPHARRVWVAAGPGNNGGDGFEAARQLHVAGHAVSVTLFGDAACLPADAADALARAVEAGVVVAAATPASLAALGADDLAIDALLGIGGRRAPEGAVADGIRRLGALGCPVLAVDQPSGLHADTGMPLGDDVVRAQHTLSLLTLKPGLFTGVARDLTGRVWFDDLDVAAPHEPPCAWLAGLDAIGAMAPARRHAQHKGSFGDLAVVGGAAGMTGAALLAARAASAAGAGRTYVQILDDAATGHDNVHPELMFRHRWAQSARGALARSIVVCGCGGGDAVRAELPLLLSAAGRLVLDADALNAIASDASLRALLVGRRGRGLPTVLTPHPLEAARLLAVDTLQVQADRFAAARELSEALQCVVLLKGSGTIVAAPGEVAWVNPTGNAALASAGTGDVLAGWIGGAWAQHGEAGAGAGALAGLPAALACAIGAAVLHGAAAQGIEAGPLRASMLIEAMVAQRTALAHSAAAASR